MSDKWEVVTKSKKSRQASGAASEPATTNGNGTKKPAKNALKMEDIRECFSCGLVI